MRTDDLIAQLSAGLEPVKSGQVARLQNQNGVVLEVHGAQVGFQVSIGLGGMTIGRATYEPGWKWSEHMRPIAGTDSCQRAHFTYIISGHFRTVLDDGTVDDFGPGDIGITPPGHDAWVVGDEPCVLFDFQGASRNV